MANPINLNPAQLLQVLRDVPLFILAGLSGAAWLLLLGPVPADVDPASVTKEWRVYTYWAATIFSMLFAARLVDRLVGIAVQWRATTKAARRLSFSSRTLTAITNVTKQTDDTYTTQFIIDIDVLNHSDQPVALAGAHFMRPTIPPDRIIHVGVSVLRATSGVSRRDMIAPHSTVLLRVHVLARGIFALPGCRACFAVRDTLGNYHRSPLIRLGGNPGEKRASLKARLRLRARNLLGG